MNWRAYGAALRETISQSGYRQLLVLAGSTDWGVWCAAELFATEESIWISTQSHGRGWISPRQGPARVCHQLP